MSGVAPISSVAQMLPSGPVVMPVGKHAHVDSGTSFTSPDGVTRPMLSTEFRSELFSVNHMLPSGPAAMSKGWESLLGTAYSCTRCPDVAITPILLPVRSVNHMLPSGPAAILYGFFPFPILN